ncbi:MAG TPA: transcription antitermination factor NusB [Gammaproteobacteria bacterium]|nr:transcription antitermination factor NusB [Gammaproteobacteria bacterium]
MSRPNARSRARKLAMQALYQWQLTGDAPRNVLAQFVAEHGERRESAYFSELFMAAADAADELDALAGRWLDRPMTQIDPIERAILWCSLLELRDYVEVPYRVVINEAVELAKAYGGEAGHKYINAVLDRAAGELRPVEAAHRKRDE